MIKLLSTYLILGNYMLFVLHLVQLGDGRVKVEASKNEIYSGPCIKYTDALSTLLAHLLLVNCSGESQRDSSEEKAMIGYLYLLSMEYLRLRDYYKNEMNAHM